MNLPKNLFQSFIVVLLYKYFNKKSKLYELCVVFAVAMVSFSLLKNLFGIHENFESNNAVDITGRINHKIVRLTNEFTVKDSNNQYLKYEGNKIISGNLTNNNNQQSDSFRFRFIDTSVGSYSNNAFVTSNTKFAIKTNGKYLRVKSAGGNVELRTDINEATLFNIEYKNRDSKYTEIGDEVYIVIHGQTKNLTVLNNVLKSVDYKVGEKGSGESLSSQFSALFSINNKFGDIYENLSLSSSIENKNQQVIYDMNENKIVEKIVIPPVYNDYVGSMIYYLDKNNDTIMVEKTKIMNANPITEINVICHKVMIKGSNIKPTTPRLELYGESVYYSKLMEYPNMKNVFPDLIKKNDNSMNDYGSIDGSELPYVVSDYSMSMWVNINDKNSDQKIKLLDKNMSPSIEINKASNNNYYLSVTSKIKNKEKPDTPTLEPQNELLIANKDYNIIALFKNKIDKAFGWSIVKPRNYGDSGEIRYYLVNQPHKYYYEITNVGDKINNYADRNNLLMKEFSSLKGYYNRGKLDINDNNFMKTTVELYLNGRLISKTNETANLIYNNNDRLVVGKGNSGMTKNGFVGNVYGVKFANYMLSESEINDLSIRKTENVIKYVVINAIDGNKNSNNILRHTESIPHIYLPSYDKVFSIGGWFRIDSEDLNIGDDGKIFLLKKGNESKSDFSIGVSGYSKVSFNVGGVSVSSLDKELPIKTWVHLTYVYDQVSNELALYVNGNSNSNYYMNNNMSSKQVVSPPKMNVSYVPLQVGPFYGKVKDVFFSNYAMSEQQVSSVMGNHPDTRVNNTVIKIFQKVTDCQGIPFNLDINPDSQSAFAVKEYVNNASNMEEDVTSDEFRKQVNDKFKLLKMRENADKYKTPGKTFQKEIYKKDYQFCYRNPFNPDDKTNCGSKGSTGATKKCLPLAPYKCPGSSSVNDFDIRTHKDFYKYVKNSKVRPPMIMEKKAPLGSYNITMNELSKHKNFKVIKNQMLENLDLAYLINKIDNPEILKRIAINLNNNANINLGELITSTDNKNVLKKTASSLLKSQELDLDQVVAGLDPQQSFKILNKMMGDNKISNNNLLQLVKNSDELTGFIKQGLDDGSINVEDLLNGQSSGNLKQVILDKCGNYNIDDIPGATDKIKKIIASKGLMSRDNAERMRIDMTKYIRKDQIPCVGCKLK